MDLQRIRIIAKGWEAFTGDLGGVSFHDGLSDHVLPQRERDRLGSLLAVESCDDGVQSNAAATSEKILRTTSAEVREPMRSDADVRSGQSSTEEPETALTAEPVEPIGPPATADVEPLEPQETSEPYTRQSLEKIADERGISGLREIADSMDIKGRSINELMTKILER